MQDLTVTLVQANQIWENKEANFKNYSQLLSSTTETDLIILPEMFQTAFSMNVEEFAEKMEDSKSIDWLKTVAKEKKAAIYTSLIVEENNSYYNRGIFVYPTGQIEIYDKRKRFALAGEDRVFDAGSTKKIVEYKGWKIQLQICYDLRFPEITRNALDNDAAPIYDALVYVANWPEKRNVHWKTLLAARAIENQAFVIGVNRVGKDGKELIYSGDSVFIDALGASQFLDPHTEQVKTLTLSKDDLLKIRKDLPFLKDQ